MTCNRFRARHAAAMLFALLPLGADALRNAHAADLDAGRRKAELCVACHGPGGVSANPAMPSLAGQPFQFITTQMVLFREGARKDPVMAPIAASFSNSDINDVAKYLSSLPLPPAAAAIDTARATAGKRLSEEYYCVSCHGTDLRGQQHVPRLAGQQRDYLLTQLRGFKAGTRFDMDGNMSAAVQRLPDADAQVLADYLSSMK